MNDGRCEDDEFNKKDYQHILSNIGDAMPKILGILFRHLKSNFFAQSKRLN